MMLKRAFNQRKMSCFHTLMNRSACSLVIKQFNSQKKRVSYHDAP